MSTIGERIDLLIKQKEKNRSKFAERIGVTPAYVTMLIAGKNEPSDLVITAICREFRVNEEWLRTGAGEMFIPSPASIVDELAEEYHLCPEAQAMVEKFITLDPAAQLAVFDYMCEVVDEIRGTEDREDRLRDELERQLTKEKTDAEKSEA